MRLLAVSECQGAARSRCGLNSLPCTPCRRKALAQLRAACAGHVPAVQAAVAMSEGCNSAVVAATVPGLVEAMATVFRTVPDLVTPAFVTPLVMLLSRLPQVGWGCAAAVDGSQGR